MQRNGTEEKMVSLLERPAPCVFVLIHYGTERNGDREGGEGEGEKVRNYLYIIWKTETLRVTLM